MKMKIKVACLIAVVAQVWLPAAVAMQPPTPEQLEQYTRDGTLLERQERAAERGNNKFSPELVTKYAKSVGALPQNFTPPSDWTGGLPASGTPKVPVILVDFSDYPHTVNASNTTNLVYAKFFGNGQGDSLPYESLRNYYQRSSYNALTIGGNVLGWYRAQHPRAYYQAIGDGPGQEALMMEALNYYASQGHNFAQYDNDNNGTLDALFLKWTGPDNGWANFWWAYQWGWHSYPNYTVSGKHVGKYVWSWIARPTTAIYAPQVDIHETGHLLGLPDLYDYDGGVGPDGGVGGLDMMDGNWGDHNAFSKAMLGWLTPAVVAAGTSTRILSPTGTSKHAVRVMPGATANLFSEYFLAQYRKRNTGNDPSNYPTDGLVTWHIDATLNAGGTDFLYDNSYTSHKLVRLMEADGLEEIESSSAWADAGDFYVNPKVLTPTSSPNTKRYNGTNSNVSITGISAPTSTITATFATGATAAPDFVVASMALSSIPTTNGTFNAVVTVKNQGTAAGTPGTLQVWANQANTPTCNATGDKSATLTSSLAAGASIPVTVSGLPAGAAGAKILRAFVDSKCQTPEPSEVNNQKTASYTVKPPTPDFVVTSVVPSPIGPVVNGTFSAVVTIKNQGTAMGTPSTLQVWANQPTTQACNAVGNKSLDLTRTSIAGGASTSVTVSGLPAGTAGAKTLRAFVDSKCLVAELSDVNNQTTQTYTVFARPIADFVVTNIALNPTIPTANVPFTVTVTVKNQGSGSGDGGYLDVWANQAFSQTCGANGTTYGSVGVLAPGASKALTFTLSGAASLTAKTLRAFVDSYCQTTEALENNNQATKSYFVH